MALAHRWSTRNLSRLELVFAITVIALLMGAFLERGLRMFALSEERALQATVLNLNSALRVQFYHLIIAGRASDARQWQNANPIQVLEESADTIDMQTLTEFPELARFHAAAAGLGSRYLGEFDYLDPGSVEGGQWYFDRTDSVLVYWVRNREFFRSPLPGTSRIRFRLDVRYNPDSGMPADVAIRSVDEYQWIEAGVKP